MYRLKLDYINARRHIGRIDNYCRELFAIDHEMAHTIYL